MSGAISDGLKFNLRLSIFLIFLLSNIFFIFLFIIFLLLEKSIFVTFSRLLRFFILKEIEFLGVKCINGENTLGLG